MNSLRPLRLTSALVCLCGLMTAVPSRAQNQPAPTPGQQQPGPQPPTAPPKPNPNNPFENIPQAEPTTPQQPPAQPQFEAPKPPEQIQGPAVGSNILESVVATGVNQFASDLTSDGIPFTSDFYQGGCHDWPFWQTAFTQSWPMLQSALGI